MNKQELLQKRTKVISDQEALLNTILKENRNMTVDEKATFDNYDVAIDGFEQQVEMLDKVTNRVRNLEGASNDPNPIAGDMEPKNKELSLGEIMQLAAHAAGARGIHNIADIKNAASGASANVPSDGGFLLSPTRTNEIMQKIYTGGEIVKRCDTFDIGEYSDSMEVPYINETSRANGSRWGGFRAYRAGEVETPTGSKGSLGVWEVKVTDLKSLHYITDRLLNDAPAMESLMMAAMPQEFTFKLEDEILNGTGGAQCKGIIGDVATVNAAKETGQAATTLVAENIFAMYTRCWGRSRSKSAWFHNQNIEKELFAMALSVGTGGVPVFTPANGLSASPYNTLFGKQLIPTEQCQALGTSGDIILADFNEYGLVRKGGLNFASSMHVQFLTDEMTFKFSMRVNGKPKWNKVLTPFKGSASTDTLSPFVTLATRS